MASTDIEIANLAFIRLGANTITSMTDGSRNATTINTIYGMIRDEVLRSFDWGFAKKRAYLDEKTPNTLAITGVTGANPGVVTYTGTDPEDGDKYEINDVVGMTELNTNQYVIDNVSTVLKTFKLLDTDTSGFTAYGSAGSAERVLPITDNWAYCYDKPSDCLAVRNVNDDPDIKFEMTDDGILCNEQDIFITYTRQVTTVSLFDVSFVSAFASRLAGEMAIAITGSKKKMELNLGFSQTLITKAKTSDAKETKDETNNTNKYADARR